MTIEETLKRCIEDSGETIYRIAKDSGIDYATVHRFVNEHRDARLSVIQKLADYFELELRPRKGKRKTPAER